MSQPKIRIAPSHRAYLYLHCIALLLFLRRISEAMDPAKRNRGYPFDIQI